MKTARGTSHSDEARFLADTVGLRSRLQSLYEDSRRAAQAEKWEEHLQITAIMVPCLGYLDLDDWVARIFGRMAWSYVRLGQQGHAETLLELAEDYDVWQAAANYYWAAEYSHRAGLDGYAGRCLRKFRELCHSRLPFDREPPGGDLALAVAFYRNLVRHEDESGSFSESNNQSDKGRHFELRARLHQRVVDFERAARYYQAADLSRYAACCRGFAHLTQARLEREQSGKKKEYGRAFDFFRKTPIFAGEVVRDVLILYCTARVELASLVEMVSGEGVAPEGLVALEAGCKKLASIVLQTSPPDEPGLYQKAIDVPTLSGSRVLEEVMDLTGELNVEVVPDDIDTFRRIEAAFDELQAVLPSYTFLAARQEEEK